MEKHELIRNSNHPLYKIIEFKKGSEEEAHYNPKHWH